MLTERCCGANAAQHTRDRRSSGGGRTGSVCFTVTSGSPTLSTIHPGQRTFCTYFDANAADVGLLASSVRQQDVLGLQVAVDDAFAVEDAHGGGDLLEENPQRVLPQRPFS